MGRKIAPQNLHKTMIYNLKINIVEKVNNELNDSPTNNFKLAKSIYWLTNRNKIKVFYSYLIDFDYKKCST